MSEYDQFLMASEYRTSDKRERRSFVKSKADVKDEAVDPFQKDVEKLRELYGLEKGTTIEMTLAHALEILHRDRKRSDAFRGLKNHLRKIFGVDLILTSRKKKILNKGENKYDE